jgi:hypothetical protein
MLYIFILHWFYLGSHIALTGSFYCHLPIGYHSNRYLSNYLCPKKISKRFNFEIIVMHSINLITDYNRHIFIEVSLPRQECSDSVVFLYCI